MAHLKVQTVPSDFYLSMGGVPYPGTVDVLITIPSDAQWYCAGWAASGASVPNFFGTPLLSGFVGSVNNADNTLRSFWDNYSFLLSENITSFTDRGGGPGFFSDGSVPPGYQHLTPYKGGTYTLRISIIQNDVTPPPSIHFTDFYLLLSDRLECAGGTTALEIEFSGSGNLSAALVPITDIPISIEFSGSGFLDVARNAQANNMIQPSNFEDRYGRLHRVCQDGDGDIRYFGSDFTVPLPNWRHDLVHVADTGTDGFPRVTMDFRDTVWIVFSRDNGDTTFDGYETFSDDNGATWSSPTVAIAGAKFVDHAHDEADGTRVVMGYVSGKLKSTVQGPGDASPSAATVCKDDTGTDLAPADDTFGVSHARDGAARWVLSFVVLGEGTTSEWTSTDTITWTRV